MIPTGRPRFDCDVLIAGFGPVGATLAALLGHGGLSVIVVEPQREVYPLPRAAHVDHEIMRIFQRIGVVDAIRPHVRAAPDYEFRTAGGEALLRIQREGVLGASGWPVGFNMYQPGVESAIRNSLAALPRVRVVHGARFTGILDNNPHGVVASVEQDGSPVQYAARFLVGCDGAWSPVREACGGGLYDYAFDEPWLVLDARVADESGFPRENLQLCDPRRPTSFVHMGPGRLRWEFMLRPGEDPDAMKRDVAVSALLDPWRRLGRIEVERRAVYRFHGLVARRWRSGRAFIAGDAAHQMPPFMGQGLCSGLRDAANLAWKLKQALAGGVSEALLDSYQAERDSNVRFVIEKAIEMGRVVCTLDPQKAAARDAEMLLAPRVGPPSAFPPLAVGCFLHDTPGAGTIFPQAVAHEPAPEYLDDHLAGGAWLIHRGEVPRRAARNGIRVVDVAVLPARLAGPVVRWLEEHAADAVLVRPDRYVFGSGSPDALLEAFDAWCEPVAAIAC